MSKDLKRLSKPVYPFGQAIYCPDRMDSFANHDLVKRLLTDNSELEGGTV